MNFRATIRYEDWPFEGCSFNQQRAFIESVNKKVSYDGKFKVLNSFIVNLDNYNINNKAEIRSNLGTERMGFIGETFDSAYKRLISY